MFAVVCHGKKDLRIEKQEDRPLSVDEVRVEVAYGGICGSDMHYYHRGGVGDFSIKEPMTLGHEISGRILETGRKIPGIEPGMKAALDPSRPCLSCEFCRSGRSNLCSDMYFLGSAGRFPHVQGGFAQHLILRNDQIIPVPESTDLLSLSLAEPLSVALHAIKRAGNLFGKKVIVTGSGPIGLLTAIVALNAGAAEVISTDIEDGALEVAKNKIGVHDTINVATKPQALQFYAKNGGYFDLAIEASGAATALISLFEVVKRGGRIVQLGMLPPGNASIPVNLIQTLEVDLVGSFRAHDEFRLAVDMIVGEAIGVSPILSGTYSLRDATAAFEKAGDRSSVVKLHLKISDQ